MCSHADHTARRPRRGTRPGSAGGHPRSDTLGAPTTHHATMDDDEAPFARRSSLPAGSVSWLAATASPSQSHAPVVSTRPGVLDRTRRRSSPKLLTVAEPRRTPTRWSPASQIVQRRSPCVRLIVWRRDLAGAASSTRAPAPHDGGDGARASQSAGALAAFVAMTSILPTRPGKSAARPPTENASSCSQRAAPIPRGTLNEGVDAA